MAVVSSTAEAKVNGKAGVKDMVISKKKLEVNKGTRLELQSPL
ncbi:hypothetical protein PR001_g30218 [Phytophthora rubi]|uniref:Uncharacterized protein n=1 Tax=Phytophthora rubi TaxID=129364 RepID=A0A6A3GVG1_9STRA|nr:hypothetical protein PR001_g30218 [Phytophthora rubi]